MPPRVKYLIGLEFDLLLQRVIDVLSEESRRLVRQHPVHAHEALSFKGL